MIAKTAKKTSKAFLSRPLTRLLFFILSFWMGIQSGAGRALGQEVESNQAAVESTSGGQGAVNTTAETSPPQSEPEDDRPEPRASQFVPNEPPASKGFARKGELSVFALRDESDQPRGYFFPPLVSLFLPGFDQWWEGQYSSAFIYSGIAVGGYVYAAHAQQDVKANPNPDDEDDNVLDAKGIAERKVMLGLLTAQGAGGISAYHSFRSAVRTRKGKFEFLKYEESPKDIMLAPFRFDFLSRKTTFIPLGVGLAVAAISIAALDQDKTDDMERSRFTGADAFFSSALSYNAGTHEEAVFRGWLMPTIMEWSGSETFSAVSSAAIFAAAHLSTNERPIPQFALGWYWGYLSQRNDWTISEGVFIHAWWDVIFFATGYQFEKIKKSDKPATSTGLRVGQTGLDRQPSFWLPPLAFVF